MEWWQEFLAVVRVDQVALAGLVTLAVVLLYRGLLVPRTTLEDARNDRDAWKAAYLESEKARSVLMTQNGELLEVARTANQILRSLPGGEASVEEATRPVRKDGAG